MPTPVRRVRTRAAACSAGEVTHALLLVDQRRLQGAAWGEFHTARKRLEKATRDLHRHEEVDVPEYQRWLYTTFPTAVSRLRELGLQVESLGRKIQAAQAHAFQYGGSLKRVWREQRAREANPPPPPSDDADAGGAAGDAADQGWEPAASAEKAPPNGSSDVRAIYRRLVQRLHPDRGGPWTAGREQLWHQVQQAWAKGDADWLARLELEWETAHEVLGPDSPVGRLRRAIEEVEAARRDIERKLRGYREEPAWRFTKSAAKRGLLRLRTERQLLAELTDLQQQLAFMQRTVAAWEEDWTKPRSKAAKSSGAGPATAAGAPRTGSRRPGRRASMR